MNPNPWISESPPDLRDLLLDPGDPMWPGPTTGNEPRAAANLLYCPKPSTAEKERGIPEHFPLNDAGRRNHPPTIKPVSLCRYLVRLVTPPGGEVVDPFMGSGAMGIACELEGFGYWGAELDAHHHAVSHCRIEHAHRYPEAWADTVFGGVAQLERAELEALGQTLMF